MGRAASVLGLALFVGLGMALSADERLKRGALQFADFIQANPWQGVALHAVLSTAVTVSGMPFALIDLAAAWVYRETPLAAVAMLFFAKTVGSAVCFAIARSVLSAQRKRDLLSHRTIARVNRVLKQSPVWYGTLVRLATLPAAVKNYGLALLEIEFPTCEFFPLSCASRARLERAWCADMLCCMLGSVVGVPLQAVLGMQLGAVYLGVATEADQEAGLEVAVASLVGVISLLLVVKLLVAAALGGDEEGEEGEGEADSRKER